MDPQDRNEADKFQVPFTLYLHVISVAAICAAPSICGFGMPHLVFCEVSGRVCYVMSPPA